MVTIFTIGIAGWCSERGYLEEFSGIKSCSMVLASNSQKGPTATIRMPLQLQT